MRYRIEFHTAPQWLAELLEYNVSPLYMARRKLTIHLIGTGDTGQFGCATVRLIKGLYFSY